MSSDPLPRLGSLAQSARLKQLKTARGILIAIGILTIVVNGIQLATLRSQVQREIQAELRKIGGPADPVLVKQVEDDAVRVGTLIFAGTTFLGVVFIVLGFMVKSYPVPITLLGLILYVVSNLGFMIFDPVSIAQGIIIKIVIVVFLAKAVQAAFAYQREQETETFSPAFQAEELDWSSERKERRPPPPPQGPADDRIQA